MFLDSNGLIVQKDGDGGDTAGREGDYWFNIGLANSKGEASSAPEFKRVLELLQVSPGVFVRNPVHYNDPKDFSRDQTMPLILAMGEMKEYGILKETLKQQLKRFTFYQNRDIATPQDWGYYIRAFRAWYLYPVLLVGDLFMLTNSVIRCIKGNDNDTSDDINHTLSLLQAQHVLQTPIGWLARKIYVTFRKGGVQNAWDNYFNPASGANNFNEIYSDLIKEM